MDISLRETIDNVLLQETNIDPSTIDPSSPIRDQISIDSMQFISIVAHLELKLKINIPTSLMRIQTLNELYQQLEILILNARIEAHRSGE